MFIAGWDFYLVYKVSTNSKFIYIYIYIVYGIGYSDMTNNTRFYLFQSGIVLGYFSIRFISFSTSWNFFIMDNSFIKMVLFSAALTMFEGVTTFITSQISSGREQKTIYVTIIVQAIIALILAVLFIIFNRLNFFIILILVILVIFVDSIREPLADSTIPQLIKLSSIANAVRVRRIMGSVSRVLGPMLASVLVVFLGVSETLFISFFILLVSFVLNKISLNNIDINIESAKNKFNPIFVFISSLSIPIEKLMLSIDIFVGLISSATMIVFVPKLSIVMNSEKPALIAGIASSFFGLGFLFGAFYLNRKLEEKLGIYRTIVLSILIVIFISLFLTLNNIYLIYVFSFIFGLCLLNLNILFSTFRLILYPESIRTKLISNSIFVSCVGKSIGACGTLLAMNYLGNYPVILLIMLFSSLYLIYFLLNSRELKCALNLSNEDAIKNYSNRYERILLKK